MLQRLNERAASRWAVLACLGISACTLDTRTLHRDATTSAGAGRDPGGAGSSATGSGASAGSGVDASSGGTGTTDPSSNAGSGVSPLPPLVDGCADLDSDGVADCKVTLAKNPSFETDVAEWKAVDGASLTWDSDNALADTPSGCARLRAGADSDSIYRASQCVAVPADQIIIAYANARVDVASAGTQMVHAELEVSFFDDPDCGGKSTGYFATPPSEASKDWVIVQAGSPSGPKTAAVSLSLVGIRPDPTNQQSVCFDNVMVKAKPLR